MPRVLDFVTKEEINSVRLIKKIKYMSFDEDEEVEAGFKMSDDDIDEPLDMPDLDFGLDEEDPDKDH